MNWRVIGASVVGSSHVQTSAPCQDSCFYHVAKAADGSDFLVALASDGAGSAQFGEVGAEIACETGGKLLLAAVEAADGARLTVELVSELLEGVRAEISKAATVRDVATRALACTLLGAVIGPTQALYFQVGDGAIVARHEGGLAPVFWPESGEYANMTYFVTDADAPSHLRAEIRSATDEAALFSDGLQRLALVFSDETAHEPFFEPMFKALRASTDEQTDSLRSALERFLGSKAINERTDDDKTLILATRALGAVDVSGV
ncbi:PP2C family serine/threonine-protein phosphatase [Paraburkholderia aspalathi]|uniref:Protein phosphatase 2C n=1 Tax=Paraburkholderia aspalathi TaxID=1324617 RepID=A0A1I7EPS0_9BURK|nr:PP2C family serine/threonine-protein phosphatase [Paraburkholderia aspalathi]SFU25877.1 Protein phosphatase 2C [Paraburkholderia aspalathi]